MDNKDNVTTNQPIPKVDSLLCYPLEHLYRGTPYRLVNWFGVYRLLHESHLLCNFNFLQLASAKFACHIASYRALSCLTCALYEQEHGFQC